MDFKNMLLKPIFPILLIGLLLIGLLFWKLSSKADLPASGNNETQNPVQNALPVPQMASEAMPGAVNEEDTAIQEQLDRDRRQQKETKDLRIKLEQTNLELEQEKALAEINKLKKENRGAFNEPAVDGQNNLPEIKVDYIGGNSAKKEAILSIGGASYQVKEKSSPTDSIQVVSISDSSVTLHISAPQDLTKIIDYKPG
jgi:hypothetical protein